MNRIPLQILLMCAVVITGCSSNLGQNILTGRQMNAAAMATVNDLAQANVITDPATVDTAVVTSQEATAAFDDAQTQWVAGKNLDASFALRRAQGLLEKVLLIQAQAKEKQKAKKAATQPIQPSAQTPALPENGLPCPSQPYNLPSLSSHSDNVPSRSTASRQPAMIQPPRMPTFWLPSTRLAFRSLPSRNAVAA